MSENFFTNKPKLSSKVMEERMEIIMERLRNSVKQSAETLTDINDTLEEMIQDNTETVHMAEVYETWQSKIKNNM